MIKIAIIGCGHWGPNYIRNFMKTSDAEVKTCCDLNQACLDRVKVLFSTPKLTQDHREILKDKDIDAVVVATPASTHYKIVKEALESGKDVLAEKPLTLMPEESLELANLAKKQKKILMVGHTFLFNSGIAKLKECIDQGEIGKIYYMNATRTHLGLIRNDVNAIWDLAPHDVSIFNYLLNARPISVNAIGACHLKGTREDVAFINLIYPENIIANIHVSWADSNKERTIRVVGSESRIVFNDLDNLERIKLYKKGIKRSENYDDFGEFQLHLRDGDIISPKIQTKEPLKEECMHFLDCVQNRKKPITDGMNGYDVVKVMCAIERSIKNNGKVEAVD